MKITIILLAMIAGAAPAFAGPSACFAECAAKHDGRQAACRVKSGSDVVKKCIDQANASYQSCRRDCATEYNLQQSSGTATPPPQKPAR